MATQDQQEDFFNREKVENSYNEFSEKYHAFRHNFDNSEQLAYLNKIIPHNSTILDAGCGAGTPVVSFFLGHNHNVTGTDVSEDMLKIAKKENPNGTFVHEDTVNLNFEENKFDLITSFYSIFHINREKHREVYENFYKFLKPNGYGYFSTSVCDSSAAKEYNGVRNFGGFDLPYSYFSHEYYIEMFKEVGFSIEKIEKLVIFKETMYWFLVKKQETKA